ncbi:hypothetical protein [Catenulispora acidiphila]|nr:hypothetical protein [Catenulispora acidiphila]
MADLQVVGVSGEGRDGPSAVGTAARRHARDANPEIVRVHPVYGDLRISV